PAGLPMRIVPCGAEPGFARLRSGPLRLHASRSKLRPKADFERESATPADLPISRAVRRGPGLCSAPLGSFASAREPFEIEAEGRFRTERTHRGGNPRRAAANRARLASRSVLSLVPTRLYRRGTDARWGSRLRANVVR